jgi:hypothetical protein
MEKKDGEAVEKIPKYTGLSKEDMGKKKKKKVPDQ